MTDTVAERLGADYSGDPHSVHSRLRAQGPAAPVIAFGGLLARFGAMTLAVPADSLRWRPSTLIHGLEALPVRLSPAQ